jgi:hypothetical protein
MLQCNMTHTINTQLVLEDLLAEMQYARKHDELGRLALLAYCDVKGWARRAGKQDVADLALRMFSENPYTTKNSFLQGIDDLIATLQMHEDQYTLSNSRHNTNATTTSNGMAQY